MIDNNEKLKTAIINHFSEVKTVPEWLELFHKYLLWKPYLIESYFFLEQLFKCPKLKTFHDYTFILQKILEVIPSSIKLEKLNEFFRMYAPEPDFEKILEKSNKGRQSKNILYIHDFRKVNKF